MLSLPAIWRPDTNTGLSYAGRIRTAGACSAIVLSRLVRVLGRGGVRCEGPLHSSDIRNLVPKPGRVSTENSP